MQFDEVFSSNTFPEISTKNIFDNSTAEVIKQLERVKKFPLENRANLAVGWVFEAIALNENLESHHETNQQREIRKIIENLFQNTDISLGEEWASKPDDVSVIFDSNGKPIIDEIVETKFSIKALEHGINKKQSQPEHSIQTIEKIVDLLNTMTESVEFDDLEVIKQNKSGYRRKFLKNVYNKIKDLGVDDKITFSNNLKYHVILPKGEFKIIPPLKLSTKDGKSINVAITRSKFTQDNIFRIIDHYAENDIE